MSMKKIILVFPKATSDLTGNALGRSVFEQQIKTKISGDNSAIEVEIPESINDIGTSFIQGIYAYLSETYGSEEALEKMALFSKNVETNEKIKQVIDTYGI